MFLGFVLNVLIHGPNLSHFYKNFQGFTYCSVFKVLCCFATARLLYHSLFCLSTAFFNFFSNFFFKIFDQIERRKRDLNPRASFPTYTLSRGASSASWVFLPNRSLLRFLFAFCRFRQTHVLLYKTLFILSITFFTYFFTFFHLLDMPIPLYFPLLYIDIL